MGKTYSIDLMRDELRAHWPGGAIELARAVANMMARRSLSRGMSFALRGDTLLLLHMPSLKDYKDIQNELYALGYTEDKGETAPRDITCAVPSELQLDRVAAQRIADAVENLMAAKLSAHQRGLHVRLSVGKACYERTTLEVLKGRHNDHRAKVIFKEEFKTE